MRETMSFEGLLRRVRGGDQEAAALLAKEYEPEIRREARRRLQDSNLRRIIDSTDICQSVMANFFLRAALGQFEIEDPKAALRLLLKMTRNRVREWARREQAQRRDRRRLHSMDAGRLPGYEPVAPGPSPSAVVATEELINQFRDRLSEEERRIASLRGGGVSWGGVAAEFGQSPDALRKRLARAIDRVAKELGLEDLAGVRAT